jgi:hypothetical protein
VEEDGDEATGEEPEEEEDVRQFPTSNFDALAVPI